MHTPRTPFTALALAVTFATACQPGTHPTDDAAGANRDAAASDALVTSDATDGAASDALVTTDATDGAASDAPVYPFVPRAEPGRHTVTLGETRSVVPGPGLPAEITVQPSNNNLDVVRHSDGRVYMAWRSAPNHFASPETRIHIISSTDETTWRFEHSFALDTDLREPRLLSWNGRLFLYISRLGTDPTMFVPQGVSVTEKTVSGWSDLENTYIDGFLTWRTRVVNGTPYMLGYLHGENLYRFNDMPMDIHFLTTTDGRTWTGVDPAMPVIQSGGGTETDFVIADNGTLYGVTRAEQADAMGSGSKVCTAPAGHLAQWTCVHDPRKYDSPVMFYYDGEAYLIGRRNVTPSGNYELPHAPGTTRPGATAIDEVAFSGTPKRCSLWRYVQGEQRIAFMADLPSRGDTCYAAVIDGAHAGQFIVYDYSSPVDGPDVPWNVGQRGDTNVYRTVLDFARR